MRQTGAEAGAAFAWLFSVLLFVVLPPAQLAAVVVPAGIAYAVRALARGGDRGPDRPAASGGASG